jgi:hypothetical protein
MRTYESTFGGWSWTYRLVPSELVIDGKLGNERHHSRHRLVDCEQYPERQLRYGNLPPPARFWLLFICFGLTLFGTSALLAFALDRFTEPHNLRGACLMFFGLYGNVPIGVFLHRRFRKRRVERWVTFRHVSDGSPYFSITCSAPEPTEDLEFVQFTRHLDIWKADPKAKPTDEFECFVAEVLDNIKRINEPDGRSSMGPSTEITNPPA